MAQSLFFIHSSSNNTVSILYWTHSEVSIVHESEFFRYIQSIMNIRAIADKVGLDYENIIEDFCGDVKALSEKLSSFTETITLEDLKASIEKKDYDGARKAAKAIRKGAEKVGLKDLVKAAQYAEEAKDEKLHSAVASLIEKYEEIKKVLDENK